MPAVVIESNERVSIPRAYFDAPLVRATGAGSTLKGAHRAEHLAALGVDDDGAPMRLLRHLVPSGVKRATTASILAAHKGDAILSGWNPKAGCPLLASLGIGAAAQYASQRRNGERAPEGIALRAATFQCPYCLGAAIAADVKHGRRELSREHLAALRAAQ